MIAVQLQQIYIPPGQHIVLKNINWQKFENILLELGECGSSRIYYYQETLEIMTPLPEHERIKVI